MDSKAGWILSNRINERWLLLLLRFVPNLWKMTKFVLNAESGISGSETRHDDEQNLILTIEVANNLILSLIGPDICDQSFDMKRPTRRFFRYRRYNSISKRINHFVPSTFGASLLSTCVVYFSLERRSGLILGRSRIMRRPQGAPGASWLPYYLCRSGENLNRLSRSSD